MTDKFYFKKITSEDLPYCKKLFLNKAVMDLNYGRPFTDSECEQCFAGMLSTDSRLTISNTGNFKVYLKDSNEFIGICSLTPDYNTIDQGWEITYMLLPKFWHKGYGTDLVAKLIDISKDITDIHVLFAITGDNNMASMKVLKKNNFKTLRESTNPDDNSKTIIFTLKL